MTSTTFTVSWNSIIGASSYRVDVATTSDFTSGFVTNYNNRTVTNAVSVNVIELTPGTIYYIRVRAVNDQIVNPVTSENSPTAEQITITSPPNGLTLSLIEDLSSLNANWDSVIGAVDYIIEGAIENGSGGIGTFSQRGISLSNNNVVIYSESALDNSGDTINYIRVRARNNGGLSNPSNIAQIRSRLFEPVRESTTINSFDNSITFRWSRPNNTFYRATSYTIIFSENSNFSSSSIISNINPSYSVQNNIGYFTYKLTFGSPVQGKRYYLKLYGVTPEGIRSVPILYDITFPII